MPNFFYYQQVGGPEDWKPIPVSHRYPLETDERPMFITALSVSKLPEDLSHEDKLKLAYSGSLYFDFDSKDPDRVLEKVLQFIEKLEAMKVDLTMCKLYATGGRGYHIEVPMELFMDKVPKTGIVALPAIYREMAMALVVDTLDMTIYSAGRGRMWRMPNVKRDNGHYKVAITLDELKEMTGEVYQYLTSEPRPAIAPKAPELCLDLAIIYTRAVQKVDELMKKRAKFKPDPAAREKATCASVQWMMAGIGIKAGTGFQEIATQLAIAAVTAGWKEDQLVEECAGLIASHQSDGNRYNSEGKRAEELRRMHRYMNGNICYEFSIGALKSMMTHSAPDLDGLPATKDEVMEGITEAARDVEEGHQDEYGDVAKGITLAKFGVYMDTEFGKKRICAMAFKDACVLQSSESGQIIGYETDVLINGKVVSRQMLEIDVFAGLMQFNRFASKYGHAFQGTDVQVRMLMMRFVEQAKKNDNVRHVLKREGLDVISIPHHENELFREPFLVWSDANGIVLPENIQEAGLELTFAAYPDPRGLFKTDISTAPALAGWIKQPGNRDAMRDTLQNLMTCQRSELLAKLLGWYTACFWKQMFQRAYGQFPLMHVNGAAGLGKTSLNIAISSLFYYRGEARPLTPGSTVFAIGQHVQASSSIPLIVDEYKPHEMARDLHNKIKLFLRDAYNQRDVATGGGNRESTDYRSLQFTQLSAPIVFVAEAAEDEAAVMERVVLATFARPPASVGLKWLTRYHAFRANRQHLGILGQYLAASIVREWSIERLQQEFDVLYAEATETFMLTEADLAAGLSGDALKEKQNSKERSVYNHTVAKFGFQQFRKLVNAVLDNELDELMGELEGGIFSRMSDLHAATTPEYVKVLQELSDMSHHVDPARPDALRKNHEYAFSGNPGQETVEIALRTAYFRYRAFCKASDIRALFGGYDQFAMSVKDSPAFVRFGAGDQLQVPGVFVFNVDELARLGVNIFKGN